MENTIYKKTQLGLVPSEWEEIVFGDIFEEVSETTNDTERYPLYSLTIEDGVTPKSERYERSFLITKETDSYKVVKKDEFVYNPMNLRFGALARLKEDKEVAVSGYYNVFKVKPGYSPEFMDYYLKSERMMYLYNAYATGSLKEKQRVHYSQFIKFELPIPSIEEANKITSILMTWDKAIYLNEQLIKEIIKQKNEVINKLFSGNTINWKSYAIKDLANDKFTDGDWIESPYITNEGVFLIQTGNIGVGNFIDKINKKYISNQSFDDLNCTEINPGDLLICRLADPIGRSCIAPNFGVKMVTSVDVTIISIDNEKFNPLFVNYLLNTRKVLREMDLLGAGSTRKRISRKNLGNVVLKIPDLNEQNIIVEKLSNIDKLINLHELNLENLKKQKQALMQQLLTGKIRVKV